jgi:fructoselysine-6-P-deglycase FrlB-like protein
MEVLEALENAATTKRSEEGEEDKVVDLAEVEREWMVEAEKLVETFQEAKRLFMSGKVRVSF